MTKHLKKLLIACHPDRHGGDHSRMEDFYAVKNATRAGMVKQPSRCQFPGCGVAVTPHSRACRAHWRSLRRMALPLSVFCFLLSALTSPAQLPPMPAALPKLAAAAPLPSVTLAWDASQDPVVTGYRIYIGDATGRYTNSALVGGATSVVLAVQPGVTYWFAATAHDTNGVESGMSNEISWTAPSGVMPGTLKFYTYILRADWPGPAGVLQVSTNLGTNRLWLDLNPIASGGTVLVTNALPAQFFRVRITSTN